MQFHRWALVVAISGCTDAAPHFSDSRSYTRVAGGFDTLEACQAQHQDPVFNCLETLSLCANGRATFLVTDIQNAGSYELDNETVVASFGPGDVPPYITFAIHGDNLTAGELGVRPFVLDRVHAPQCN